MGTLLDTTVFIEFERAVRSLERRSAMSRAGKVLEEVLGGDDQVGISAITASELLHGVHRATDEHRARREAFVETILGAFPSIPFDMLAARVHAQVWAGLAATGTEIGAHDRIVAATALSVGWRVGTANLRHFRKVPGLEVLPIRIATST